MRPFSRFLLALALLGAPATAHAQQLAFFGGERIIFSGVMAKINNAVSINAEGWTATVTIPGVTSGGTYNLSPNSAHNLTFNVTRACYNASQVLTTCAYTVYGTVAKRNAYPSQSSNQESTIVGGITTIVALSDDILPSDVVTMTANAGWYVDPSSRPAPAISAEAAINLSAAKETYPVGQWVTPPQQRWGNGASFTVEFSAFHRFPRNGSQVAAVKIIASDGTHSVSHVVTAMSVSGQSLTTTCTTTLGSPMLSCPATAHFFVGEHVTVVPSTATAKAMGLGSAPAISALSNNASLTLNQTAFVGGTGGAASTALAVTSITSGSGPFLGMTLATQTGVTAGTSITACPSTGCGTTGAYTLSQSATIAASTALADASGASDTVTVYLGGPVYDYAASFTSTDQAALNAGKITFEAIVYPNLGALTLDTANAYAAPFSTTCTATSGSPTLTGCVSTTGFALYDHVTVSGAFAIGDAYIYTAPGANTITLDNNALASGAVTIAEGVAASAISPNLKNLQAYNDVGSVYGSACAWVLSTGTASGTTGVGYTGGAITCATAPSGTTANYYASEQAAAVALAAWNNATGTGHPTLTHNDACGSTIYLAGAQTGVGGSAMATYSPTNCGALLTVAGAPALVAANAVPTITAHATLNNNNHGYSTQMQDLILTDTASAKQMLFGPDGTATGNGPTPRLAHVVLKNVEAIEVATSGCQANYNVGWVQFYASYINEGTCKDYWLAQGVAIGSYVFGPVDYVWLNVSLGNIYNGFYATPEFATVAVDLPASAMISAFDRWLNVNASSYGAMAFTQAAATTWPMIRQNIVFAQDIFECSTLVSAPCATIAADDDYTPLNNLLAESITTIGGRWNNLYSSRGGMSAVRNGVKLFTVEKQSTSKTDSFQNPLDYAISPLNASPSSMANATGCNGDGTSVTFPAPTSDPLYSAGAGITQTGAPIYSGGPGAGAYTVTGVTLTNNGVTPTPANLGIGYANATITTTAFNDTGCPGFTATYTTAKVASVASGVRQANWRWRSGVGGIGNVVYSDFVTATATGPGVALGEYFGLNGATGALSYVWANNASATACTATDGGCGSGRGLGYYKPTTTTGLINRVPSGFAPFPGDIEGTARKNDGTGCAGAYEC